MGVDLAELSEVIAYCPTHTGFPEAFLIMTYGVFLFLSMLPLRYILSRFGYADNEAFVLLNSADSEKPPPVAGSCRNCGRPMQPVPGGVAPVARKPGC